MEGGIILLYIHYLPHLLTPNFVIASLSPDPSLSLSLSLSHSSSSYLDKRDELDCGAFHLSLTGTSGTGTGGLHHRAPKTKRW